MKRALAPLLVVLAGVAVFWYVTRDTTPASISPEVNLGEVLQFTGEVSLRPRPFTGDLVLPENLFGGTPAFAGYTFRDATRTLYQYDIFLFRKGEARGTGFDAYMSKLGDTPARNGTPRGWFTGPDGQKACLIPMPNEPFRYAPGKTIIREALLFEHPTRPVEVLVIQTFVKDEKSAPRVTVPGMPPPQKLPEPGIPLHQAAPAIEKIITENP